MAVTVNAFLANDPHSRTKHFVTRRCLDLIVLTAIFTDLWVPDSSFSNFRLSGVFQNCAGGVRGSSPFVKPRALLLEVWDRLDELSLASIGLKPTRLISGVGFWLILIGHCCLCFLPLWLVVKGKQ